MAEHSRKEVSASRTQSESKLERDERQSASGYIAIKGTRNGLLLTLEQGTPFSELLGALADRLAESPAFFRGASLSIDTSQRALRMSERLQLEDLLAGYQMSVAAHEIPSRPSNPSNPATLSKKELPRSAKTIALPLQDPLTDGLATRELGVEQRDTRESADTLFLRRTVRSGQAIHYPSNVVVLGDVNPGAEIVAGGDILVWGVLRGMVHAGYPDNDTSVVCSLQLSPVQLRIAHLLSRPPEGFEAQLRPEVATIRHGQIIVETWVSGRPPRK